MNKLWHKYLIFGAFCVAIYFPVFLHLDWQPVNNWDESLFAMRAAYMAEEGHYIPNYSLWVENGMRMPSTKPPFTTWVQVLSFKVFGINEQALRLPIALCFFLLLMSMVWFSRSKLGDIRIGYCAGFVLVTSLGFVREHGSRTGDHEAALAFYMMAGAMAFYNFLQATEKRQKIGWLSVLSAFTVACLLTKYVFGLVFFPAFLAYAIYKKQLWNVVKDGAVWLALVVILAISGGWLWYIEQQLPGFVQRAFSHEMTDRFTSVIDYHQHSFSYYFMRFWANDYFTPWLFLLVGPVFFVFFGKKSPLRDFTVLMLACTVSALLTISFSQTKTAHYDVVAYPPMAMVAGIGLYQLGAALWRLWQENMHRPTALAAAMFGLVVLVAMPYRAVFTRIYMPKLTTPMESYGYLLRKIQKTKPGCKHFTIFSAVTSGQVQFYAGLLNRKEGYQIKLSEHPKLTAVGDTVMACERQFVDTLFAHYELQPIETDGNCILAVAVAKK